MEFYSEEIPARMQRAASIILKENLLNGHEKNNYIFGNNSLRDLPFLLTV